MADLLAPALLAVMLRLSGPAGDTEPPDARAARLGTNAEAIALEATTPPPGWPWGSVELAGGVVATWNEEGARMALAVHTGQRRGDRGSSACQGQVKQGLHVTRAEWHASMGTSLEATRMCARLTARILALHARRCLGKKPQANAWNFAIVVAGYGSGWSCNARMRHRDDLRFFALERGRHWWLIDHRLEDLLHPPRSALARN